MIRVMLVNEYKFVNDVLVSVLEDEADIQVVKQIDSPNSFEYQPSDLYKCDLVLISPRLPGNMTMETIKQLKKLNTEIKVLIFGLEEATTQVLPYIENGIDGYISTEAALEEAVAQIRAACPNKIFVSPNIAGAMISLLGKYGQIFDTRKTELLNSVDLTPRQMEVLELIAEDLTNAEIAARMGIEVGTVKNHVHMILNKLEAVDRQDAAAYLPLLESPAYPHYPGDIS
jgi:DNA-binding NarL/FixJ family response regulator